MCQRLRRAIADPPARRKARRARPIHFICELLTREGPR